MLLFFFFSLGLIIGSFLNVVVFRLKEKETLLGRSFCRHCQHQIRWYDNIPLFSFMFLGGRCRDCKARISWQYPLFELVTGVVFLFIGQYFFDVVNMSTWGETLWLLVLTSLLLVIAFYDMRHMEIPLMPLVIGFFVTAAFLLYDARFGAGNLSLFGRQLQAILGGVVVGGFFFALVFISKETWMGWGDVWLGMLSGMVVGLSNILFMMTLSFGIGALVGISLILARKKGIKSQVPFAPYLVIGTLLTLFLPEMFPVYTRMLLL